ncbi:MAG: thioredoxin-disulfide reductase [Lachnospiraceae bacterium]|nr:thioredoxin-disulfide reductase [Lachnospiraceae bacterium]MBR5943907.1 thioredoxin-disulfide reductase [Lachnospiraceae bacterium]
MYDCIIIGSGPAGLSAAVYGKRAGMDILVIEKQPVSGGQILNTYEVDNYLGLPGISGWDMGETFRAHAEKLGAPFVEEEVISVADSGSVKIVKTNQNEYQAKTVILATGAHHALLGVPGEEELTGMGVSYCATCDGAFFRNRVACVVGGGDVAVEDAIFLAKGCSKVYLIHRRDELRAAKSLQDALLALPNVEVLWSHVPVEIKGEDNVKSFLIKDVKTGEEKEIATDAVFIAVGIHPDTELFKDIVKMDPAGYILADETCVTSAPGIYAAGDCRKKMLRQVITAVADGANAATSAFNHISV